MQNELHADLTVMLERAGASTDATESHAIVTGLAAGLNETELPTAAVRVLGDIDPAIQGDETLAAQVGSLASRVRDSLLSEDMQFDVLVPEDRPLSERVLALGSWCQGFLFGLAASEVDLDVLEDESAEVVEDLAQMAQAVRGEEDAESVESAYAEVSEFIRVGVQVVFHDLQRQFEEPIEDE